MSRFVTLIIVVVIGLFLIRHYSPGLWGQGEEFYVKHVGWTEEARRQDPVGYLNFARSTLSENVVKMNGIIRDIEQRVSVLEKEKTNLTGEQKQYEQLLKQAKGLYQEGERGKQKYPVRFVGASYTKDELVSQTRIIFNRNEQAKIRLVQLAEAQKSSSRWLGSMYEKRALAEDTVRDLYTAIVIARAHESAELVEKTMEAVAEVARDIDLYIVSYERGSIPVRDASKLASDQNAEMRDDFTTFLEN